MTELSEKLMRFVTNEYGGNIEGLRYDIENVIKDLSLSKPTVRKKTRINNLLFLYQIKELITQF